MALENTTQEILSVFPQEIISNLTLLITILQAVGIFFIIYLVFNIINTFINKKRQKDIQHIREDVSEIKSLLKRKR